MPDARFLTQEDRIEFGDRIIHVPDHASSLSIPVARAPRVSFIGGTGHIARAVEENIAFEVVRDNSGNHWLVRPGFNAEDYLARQQNRPSTWSIQQGDSGRWHVLQTGAGVAPGRREPQPIASDVPPWDSRPVVQGAPQPAPVVVQPQPPPPRSSPTARMSDWVVSYAPSSSTASPDFNPVTYDTNAILNQWRQALANQRRPTFFAANNDAWQVIRIDKITIDHEGVSFIEFSREHEGQRVDFRLRLTNAASYTDEQLLSLIGLEVKQKGHRICYRRMNILELTGARVQLCDLWHDKLITVKGRENARRAVQSGS